MAKGDYRALRLRTRWLKWFLYGWLAFSLLEIIPRLGLFLGSMGVPIDAGSVGGEQSATMAQGLAALFLLAGMVAFCFWIYRVSAKLHSFGIGHIHSPGWAVGSYFIPVASLWFGYEVMRDVWDNSGPPNSGLDGKGWLLPLWWGAWIVINILSTIHLYSRDAFDPATRAALEFIVPAAHLVAGVALIAIISKVDIAQQQQESLAAF